MSTDGCQPGGLLATSLPQDFTIPYRPSADAACTDLSQNPTGGWFNSAKDNNAGGCQFSITKVLTFTFDPNITLPDNVIWTVQYDTTNSGYNPLNATTCNLNNNNPGCFYDSLNVGTMSFTGAPYAGFDNNEGVVFFSVNTGGYPNSGGTAQPLASTTHLVNPTWTGLRPLGRITTK